MSKPELITASVVKRNLRELADADIAEHSQRFFKTGKGDYGEGDRFLGLRVPVIRAQVKKYKRISLDEICKLLKSHYHEERLCAVFMLVDQFARGDEAAQNAIYQRYLQGVEYINNWDLVDSSAHKIVGPWLETRSRKPLYKLAESKDLWERRIAMMSTYHFIRRNDFDEALTIAEKLLGDNHDLIHKAVGWMLREIGNRDKQCEIRFLKTHYQSMPRTMLRYAIEKFPNTERKRYLTGVV